MATATTDHRFEMHIVNSYGYTEVDKLCDDGTPIKFDSMICIYCKKNIHCMMMERLSSLIVRYANLV